MSRPREQSSTTSSGNSPKPSEPFALFLSCVEGHLVRRYGTPARNHIGVAFTKDGPKFDTNEIVALTAAEAAKYRREYRNALRAGSLRERTAEDFDAYVLAQEEAAKKAAKAAEEAAKKAAKANEKQNADA